MIKITTHFLFHCALATLGLAESLPPGGQEMLGADSLSLYVGKSGTGQATKLPVEGRSFAQAQQVILPQPGANAWSAGGRAKLVGVLTAQDCGVVVFEARAIPLPGAAPAGADAGGTIYLESTLPGHEKAATLTFKCTDQWQTFHLAFQATTSLPEAQGALALHLGDRAQAMQLGPVRVVNYGTTIPFRSLPRTRLTYYGQSPNAPWRAAAQARISQHRTSPLRVQVVAAGGKPVPEAEVAVKQLRSAFGFGTAVTADWLTKPGMDGDRYRALVDECFSRAVFENDLKMETWENSLKNNPKSTFRWENTQKAAAWLKEKAIPVRGHYLSWAPWEPWSEKLKAEPAKIKERILTHLPIVAAAVGDSVFEWDGINHLSGWDKNIDEVTGLDFYTEIMKACRAATKLPIWVNEDQVFRKGRQQEDYYQRIQGLIAAGQKPDGIGNQGHFDTSFMPSPEEMLANSDRFAALVPALQITEFDIMTNGDEQLEADYLRDILTVCYSHPAYTGFLTWGFWEGSHWKPSTALWRKDWSEKPAATLWKSLVNQQWATQAEGATNGAGSYQVKAHHGTYRVTVTTAGKTTIRQILLEKGGADLVVQLEP